MASIGAYMGRSLGLPISIEVLPSWPTSNNGHFWNAIIFPGDSSLSFQGAESRPNPGSQHGSRKKLMGKVYRKILIPDENCFALAATEVGVFPKDVPPVVNDLYLRDVTSIYSNVQDIQITNLNPSMRVVYLTVFNNNRWNPIAGAVIDENGNATFNNMGVGVTYLPTYYHNHKYSPAGAPVSLGFDGEIHSLKPDHENTQTIKVSRKYPVKMKILNNFADGLNNATIEGSNTPDFSESTHLLSLHSDSINNQILLATAPFDSDQTPYTQFWIEMQIPDPQAFRFFRLKTQKEQIFRLGELEFYDAITNERLTGSPLGTTFKPEWAFDGTDGFSIVYDEYEPDKWVGLDLGKPRKVGKIRFMPGQDRHSILLGENYQLFYWDEKWHLFAETKASDSFLTFNNIPQNALLRLHCPNCTFKQERPFTVSDGVIHWW